MKRIILFILFINVVFILTACKKVGDETTTEKILKDIKPSPTMCDNIPDKGDYKIAWCDEFNYRGLPDPKKWGYNEGGDGWGNNEIQYYKRASRDNVIVEDDNLIITARKEPYRNRNYTSTRLLSAGKAEFKYGYIEFRAKLPDVKGTWPALWLLGNYGKYGWPECGEIDVMEHVANDLNVIHGSIHTTDYNHKESTQKTAKLKLDDVVNTYHTYAIEWTPKQIRFFIDDINYFNFNNDEINNPNNLHSSWPFDEEMFIIMNIAVGGWGGTPDPFFKEAKMYVDYVRVYQKEYPSVDEDFEAPTQVENIRELTNDNSWVNLIWDASWDNLGVKHYEVYAKDIRNDETILLGKTDIPRYTISGLKQDTDYEIIIYAFDFNGNISKPGTLKIKTKPYPTIPGKIEAESYADMQGIDLENTLDIGGGLNVGWMDAGDYLVYYINVLEQGEYTVDYRVAVNASGAEYKLYINDDEIPLITTTFSSTGGWQNWKTVTSDPFILETGTYKITLEITKSGSNLNWLEFKKIN